MGTVSTKVGAINRNHNIHHEHIVVRTHQGKHGVDDPGARKSSQGGDKHGALQGRLYPAYRVPRISDLSKGAFMIRTS
jgi:hypothetical protein